nr:uncharacterized protein LOC109193513 [Ipomoea batatas]GMC90692.1 uncharacterized protein LOC109193513 [Ipomoea batatas]GME11836.1 uncharacterized protein LOC109193513 [Ipomoea batatas]
MAAVEATPHDFRHAQFLFALLKELLLLVIASYLNFSHIRGPNHLLYSLDARSIRFEAISQPNAVVSLCIPAIAPPGSHCEVNFRLPKDLDLASDPVDPSGSIRSHWPTKRSRFPLHSGNRTTRGSLRSQLPSSGGFGLGV